MNLRSLDLNLLVVFDAVMRERNVTRAAFKVGLSQPAVSKSLNRLRYHLKDELFVRSAEGMKATPRALELSGPIRQVLASLEQALDPAEFDPATSERVFKVASNDYAVSTLMPEQLARIRSEAPNVKLRLFPTTGQSLEMLDNGVVDFAYTYFPDLPERFDSFDVMDDDYVLIMRKGHELSKGEITPERFAEAPHLLVSLRGDDRGFVDDALEELGLSRRVVMTVNNFINGPPIVTTTDMIMTMPKHLAMRTALFYALDVRDAPIRGPQHFVRMQLIWNKRLATHPAHDWYRNLVQSTAGQMAGGLIIR